MVSIGTTPRRTAILAVAVAALGYFVDIYDLILFGMIRQPSVKDLGVPPDELLARGIDLFNWQMGGLLVGGILWGVIGDRRGRLSVLFGSITLYSIANIANGMVHSFGAYAAWRLIAGIGLAGELGAGVTLVSELLDKETRGIGTTLVAAFGVSGGIVAGFIGGAFPGIDHPGWRTAYFIGGAMGFALLLLRIGVVESGLFHATLAKKDVRRGDFFALFKNRQRLTRYVAIIVIGIPVWYAIGIPSQFATEIGKALGMNPAPNTATVLTFFYGSCTIGGTICGLLSQRLRSRRRALGLFLTGLTVVLILDFTIGPSSLTLFYALSAAGGFMTGYWAVFISTAAELFGTNLRATATTTVPNFVRGSAVLLTTGWRALQPGLDIVTAAIVVGVATMIVAFVGLRMLPETFAVDLDFHEQ